MLAVDGFVASKTYVTKAVIHDEIEGAWFGKVCGHCLYPSWFPCWFPSEDVFGESLFESSAVFGLIDEMSTCAGAASAVEIFDYAHDSGTASEGMLWLAARPASKGILDARVVLDGELQCSMCADEERKLPNFLFISERQRPFCILKHKWRQCGLLL